MSTKSVTVTQKPHGYVTVTEKKTVSSVTQPGSDVVEITDGHGGGITAGQIVPLVSYRHNQNASSTTWTINHNLKFYPNVTVFDSAGSMVEGSVTHTSINVLTIEFSSAISGYAVLS
jgi:hypothetical protein